MKIKLFALFTLLTMPLFGQDGQEPPAAPPADSNVWQLVAMVALAFVFFYFILWRPEQKRRKEQQDRLSGLKKGDRVTAVGILGTVVKVEEATVVIELYDGAKMEVLKHAIQDVVSGNGE